MQWANQWLPSISIQQHVWRNYQSIGPIVKNTHEWDGGCTPIFRIAPSTQDVFPHESTCDSNCNTNKQLYVCVDASDCDQSITWGQSTCTASLAHSTFIATDNLPAKIATREPPSSNGFPTERCIAAHTEPASHSTKWFTRAENSYIRGTENILSNNVSKSTLIHAGGTILWQWPRNLLQRFEHLLRACMQDKKLCNTPWFALLEITMFVWHCILQLLAVHT